MGSAFCRHVADQSSLLLHITRIIAVRTIICAQSFKKRVWVLYVVLFLHLLLLLLLVVVVVVEVIVR